MKNMMSHPKKMHLDDNTLARYLDGSMHGDEKKQLDLHLADCAACCEALADGYRMLQVLEHTDEVPLPTPAPVPLASRVDGRHPRGVLRWSVGLAASIAIALAVSLMLYQRMNSSEVSRFRTEDTANVFSILTPEDGATLSRNHLTFSWLAASGVMEYHLLVYADDGSIVWQGITQDTSATIPATVDLQGVYLWRVEGLRADGSTQSTSLHAFEVRE